MIILAFFTDKGTPKTGLSPTIRIRDVSDNSLIITDAATAEVGDGWYKYDFAAYDDAKEYAMRFDGGDTLAEADRYTFGANELDVGLISDTVWDEAAADHLVAGSFGAKNQKVVPSETLNDYKATGFNTVVPDAAGVVPTTIAALNNISVTDVQTALTAQGYTTARAALLDNLDTTISGVRAALVVVQADLDNPDQYKANVGLLALEASLQLVKTKTDLLKDAWNDPTATVIADTVLDRTA